MPNPLEADGLLDRIPLYAEDNTSEKKLRYQADTPRFIIRAYREAGPLFRVVFGERKWVVLAGQEANEFVWTHSELWNYPIMFPAFLEQMGPDHLNVLEGRAHSHKRTMLQPGMNMASAMRHLPSFGEWFNHELDRKAGTGPLDLIEFWAEAIGRANAESVTRTRITECELHRLTEWEKQLLAGLSKGEARHAHYARQEYIALKSEAMALLDRILDERLADPVGRTDRFGDVLRARGSQDGGYPERQCLIDDLYYILIAGVHNTSMLINWIFLYLYFTPEWRDRVMQELEPWDGHDLMALSKMNNLKAVILEIQRLRPLIHFTLRHAAQDFEFAGFQVPAGTDILCANTCCHYLEEIYADPFAFRPERFLNGGGFAPRTNGFFGGGVHVCVGRNYAMVQAPLAVARMLKGYQVTYANEPEMKAIIGDIGSILPDSISASFQRI
jgi:cytochrome P450